MPKNPHANFTPTLAGYSGISPFRFWCQTALPLTYDDSLSYYELLNKVVNYLNHTIEDLTNVENNTSELAEAYDKLQKYVNDYFDDIDIEAELRNVLDGMAEDGTLDALLDPLVANRLPDVVENQISGVVAEQIGGAVESQIDEVVGEQLPPLVDANIGEEVSDWLENNVDPVGSAVLVDSTLSISGAAADAKVTGDEINNLKTQLTHISDESKNLLYFTNTETRTLSGGATVSFPGKSEIVVNNTQSSIARISVMGNTSASASAFRPNLDAGTYTMKILPNNDTKVLVRYRNQADFDESLNKSTVWDDGVTITTNENIEVFVTIAGGTTYDNRDVKISIVPGTENKTFEQYGETTAKDNKAREAVENVNNTISAIEDNVNDINKLIKNGLAVELTSSPICYYPKTFKNSKLLTYGGNRTSTQGMCGNDNFLWFVNKTSDNANCTIVKYDILKDEIIKTISERSYGHANDMCYIEDANEIYIISWVTDDNTLYSNGGTFDRISVIDADTLEFKRDFGLASIIGNSIDYPALSAICYNPLFKLFAGVVRPHDVDGTTIKNLVVWNADGNDVRSITITSSGVTSGMDCDNKLIYCLFSYRLAYYDWATLNRIYYNTVTKVLADKEAEIGAVQEAESIVVNGKRIYVNANNMLANTDSSVIMTTIYKGEPASMKFLTLSEFMTI